MDRLSELPNIGKELEKQLNQAGIFTYEELKNTGTQKAWLKIQEFDETACIHRLLAIEGAVLGVKKTLLSEERKAQLREFYRQHKKERK